MNDLDYLAYECGFSLTPLVTVRLGCFWFIAGFSKA